MRFRRMGSWAGRLGLVVAAGLLGAGVMAPAATAAPAGPQPAVSAAQAAAHLPAGDGGGPFDVELGDEGNVQVGDRACVGNCNNTANGAEGEDGGFCAGLCDGSANGGNGSTGEAGQEGGDGGDGGICAGICHGSVTGGDGGGGGDAVGEGDGGTGGAGGDGGICIGIGCDISGAGGRGGDGGEG